MQTILEISYLRLYFNVFIHVNKFESVQFSSVTQSCPILCYPMDCSTAGLPVCNNLLEFTEKSFANLQRNFLDLTEAEGIKRRWQEYTEELYKKDLHDPDNKNCVITHLGQTSWNVKSTGPQKASLGTKLMEVMEFQLNYFSPER